MDQRRKLRQLTEDGARDIRNAKWSSQQRLAEKHRVDPKTIRNIRQGRTYQDITVRPPLGSDVGSAFHGKYLVGDVLDLLTGLPVGSAETVLMAPPPCWPVAVGDSEHEVHVRYQRYVLEECLRIVGPDGLVMYLHRPVFDKNGEVDIGSGIFRNLPLWQVVVWHSPLRYEIRTGAQRSKGFLQLQNYANIMIFAREDWRMPYDTPNLFEKFGAVWTFRRPHQSNVLPEFPLELAARCISLGSGPVLDPYAGTGTTAVAAEGAGRQWIMFDETGSGRRISERRLAGLGERDPSL